MEGKIAEGWVYGTKKSEEAKTHPSLIPYARLSEKERVKDHLFVVLAEALLDKA